MKAFRFSLEKALELRTVQLELAEAAFQQQMAAVAELDRQRENLRAARAAAEAQVRSGQSARGSDLAALGAFRLHMQAKEKQVERHRLEAAGKREERRAAMLEARRRCRLLERLRERRKGEWDRALNHEVEEAAAESFLAKWNRRQA